MMRWSTFLLTMLLLASAAPVLMDDANAATSGRAQYDFTVLDIEARLAQGNATYPLLQWNNSNGSVTEFAVKGSVVQLTVVVQQSGDALSRQPGDVEVEVWHPIGFLVAAANYTTSDLIGGEENRTSIFWIPDATHSILTEAGDLIGGFRVTARVSNFLDSTNGNDEYTREVAVAHWRDPMENRSGSLTFDELTFLPVGFDSQDTPDGAGSWIYDETQNHAGAAHWRVSRPGSDYPSNANDRIVWGWFVSDGDCGDPGHGFGFGNYNSAISTLYGVAFCEVNFAGFDVVSLQMATWGWGVMANSEDEIAIELRSGGGGDLYHNLSEQAFTAVAGQWKSTVWNLTDVIAPFSYRVSFLFTSDSIGANGGIHVDDFIIFSVEKVQNYTVTLDCDDPLGGYSLDPLQTAAMRCDMTNNGYRPVQLEVSTLVSNATWLATTNPLRIDSSNPNDHDANVALPLLSGGNTTELWINLTVPPGANVEDLNWTVRISGDGQTRVFKTISVRVLPSYGVDIQTAQASDRTMTLAPGATGVSTLKLINSGNQPASYRLQGFFEDSTWATQATLSFLNATGAPLPATVPLGLGEQITVQVEVQAPVEAGPNELLFRVQASGISPATAQDVVTLTVTVPEQRDLAITGEITEVDLAANGVLHQVPITLTNLGNAPETFDLEVQTDRDLVATLSTNATQELEAFDGEAIVVVNLPMHQGTPPDLYNVRVVATSQTGSPALVKTFDLGVNVSNTHAVEISAPDVSDLTFRGGDSDLTMKVSIRNTGNVDDAFAISLDPDSGMSASLLGLLTGRTPVLAPLGTYNVTVVYSFDDGVTGSPQLRVTATSEGLATSSATTSVTYAVGSQGRLSVAAPAQPLAIDEAGDYEISFTVQNRYPAQQSVTIDLDDGDWRNSFSARIRTSDAQLQIPGNGERTVVAIITVTENLLLNIDGDRTVNMTLVARSDLDNSEDAVTVVLTGSGGDTGEEQSAAQGFLSDNVGTLATYGIGLIIVIVLVVVLFMVLMGGRGGDDDDLYTGEGGYESSVAAAYGSVPAAPQVGQQPPPGAPPPY